MVQECEDKKPCVESMSRYNTDWKFNRLLKEAAKELHCKPEKVNINDDFFLI